MAHLIHIDDEGEVQCSDCEVFFTIIWSRRADITGIVYCPFCGDEIEEN